MAQITQEHAGKVLTLTIDRPEKKNALTNEMYGQFADALEAARRDDSVRCVVITGAGDTFTAGNDLGDFAAVASGDLKQLDRHVHRVLDVLATFEKPVVAAVPGLAVGIGTTMLLHCDLVFLAETALLSTPFVDLALVPEAASSLLLQARIGYARAFAMVRARREGRCGERAGLGPRQPRREGRGTAGDRPGGGTGTRRAAARRRRRDEGPHARTARRCRRRSRRRAKLSRGASPAPRRARPSPPSPSAASRIIRSF